MFFFFFLLAKIHFLSKISRVLGTEFHPIWMVDKLFSFVYVPIWLGFYRRFSKLALALTEVIMFIQLNLLEIPPKTRVCLADSALINVIYKLL